MENGMGGAIVPNDVATLALLGGGYWGQRNQTCGNGFPCGSGYLVAGAHADGTAIGAGLKHNKDITMVGLDTIYSNQRENRATSQFNDLKNSIAAIELNALRSNADFRQQVAECCCENQKGILQLAAQNIQDKADILAAIAANETRTISRELDAAQAKVIQLETVNAITQACGCAGGQCNPLPQV